MSRWASHSLSVPQLPLLKHGASNEVCFSLVITPHIRDNQYTDSCNYHSVFSFIVSLLICACLHNMFCLFCNIMWMHSCAPLCLASFIQHYVCRIQPCGDYDSFLFMVVYFPQYEYTSLFLSSFFFNLYYWKYYRYPPLTPSVSPCPPCQAFTTLLSISMHQLIFYTFNFEISRHGKSWIFD